MIRATRTLWHLMRADYLERVRGQGFLVTLGITLWFAYVSLPPQASRYVTFQIAETRGIYNSAWVGAVVTLLATAFLSLAGFYVVRSAVSRDRRTGVGQILASTPISKSMYTLGKTASNFAVLATIVLVAAVASVGMQLMRGEDRHIDLAALIVPHLVITLPAMAVVAALAVLFETLPALSGGFGNAAYVFVAMIFLWSPQNALMHDPSSSSDGFLGTGAIMPSIYTAQAEAFPELRDKQGQFSLGFNFRKGGWSRLRTFRWQGVHWTARTVLSRLRWVAFAIGIAMVAAVPFDRFDTARRDASKRRRQRRDGAARTDVVAERSTLAVVGHASAALLTTPVRSFSLAKLIAAELRLMLWGKPRVWFIVAAGLVVACAVTPLDVARGWLLPILWLWPLTVWSGMGSRNERHRTTELLLCSPRPIARLLVAEWLAGILVAVALGMPIAVRLVIAADPAGLAAWKAGALFLPSLALALGVWTQGSKAFEVLLTVLWYMGPMNRIPFLDYVGQSRASVAEGAWIGFGAAAAILFALAVLGRRRQLRR